MPAIIHVDMDAFYASVEQRDRPELRGKPVIVGGAARRGVVCAASYEARKFGVRSAMPMAQAMRLAPRAIVMPVRFEAYAEASEAVFEIFGSFTPLVEPLSLDEAFLDVTGSTALFGAPSQIASSIRTRIRDELRLPASAGIAAVKFVAKIASDLAKPNGQREVLADDTLAFLGGLPVGRLWGVGPKTEAHLHRLGLVMVQDIRERSLEELIGTLGEDTGHHLHALAHGIDGRVVVPDREAKSISAEDTFEDDHKEFAPLLLRIHGQALRVARRLRSARLVARVVVLKLKDRRFRITTRRTTLPSPTDDGGLIYQTCEALLRAEPLREPLRLTGVGAHGLEGLGRGQLPLFDQGEKKTARLNATLDSIADRFGTKAIIPGDLLPPTKRS